MYLPLSDYHLLVLRAAASGMRWFFEEAAKQEAFSPELDCLAREVQDLNLSLLPPSPELTRREWETAVRVLKLAAARMKSTPAKRSLPARVRRRTFRDCRYLAGYLRRMLWLLPGD